MQIINAVEVPSAHQLKRQARRERARRRARRRAEGPVGLAAESRTPPVLALVLLVSNDGAFVDRLYHASRGEPFALVGVQSPEEVAHLTEAFKLSAILLDLDMPGEAAWKLADSLLQREDCPPVAFLSGRCEQFDPGVARRAGSVMDKSIAPEQLAHWVKQAQESPRWASMEQHTIQRIFIRWLQPSRWSVPVTPARRFWGINE